jgi:hypothetical protein
MDKDTALDLALEALEKLTDTEQTYEALDLGDEAITAIKQARSAPVQALEHEPENEPYVSLASVREDWGPGPHEVHSLPAQPTPTVQEPVADAWMHEDGRLTDAKAKTARVENFHGWRPMAFIASATPPAAPVQHFDHRTAASSALRDAQNRSYQIAKAQLAPVAQPAAQRQWVGLTDVEWMNIVNKDQAWFGQRPDEVAHEVAKLVEAKLKEKNT